MENNKENVHYVGFCNWCLEIEIEKVIEIKGIVGSER